jgi:hypothetical protein
MQCDKALLVKGDKNNDATLIACLRAHVAGYDVDVNSSSNALAPCKSAVSKSSVNYPYTSVSSR